jgi:CheY-like chemotaxis protein
MTLVMRAREVLDLRSVGPGAGAVLDGRAATVALPPLLLIDGEDGAMRLVRDALDELRLVNPIVCAGDGGTAIAWLGAQLDSGPAPALVVSEARLPDCRGLEVVRWMRRRSGGDNTHVVVLCESMELDDITEAYDEGVAAYLAKPVGFDALGGVVRDIAAPWALLAGHADP